MRLNVGNFENFVRKATLNYSVNTIKTVVNSEFLFAGVRGDNCITILKIPNDSISGVKEEFEMNFMDPNQQLKTYLDLIDDDESNIKVNDEKLIIKNGRQKSTIHFCSPNLVTTFEGEGPNDVGEKFFETTLNDEIIGAFERIKKVAAKFQKVYFIVEKNKFFIETTDRTNRYSNGVKIEVGECSFKDVELCFNFKNFNSLMNVINGDFADFVMKLVWVKEQNAGMVSMINTDKSEKYYLVSSIEDTL